MESVCVLKIPKIGVYGEKTRLLQKKLSYERISLTWKNVDIYLYLGDATNASPAITDIQDNILLETRDRSYSTTPITINCWYEILPEMPYDLSRFGIINPLSSTQQFRFHSYSFDSDGLGRYLFPGDIIRVPFLEQNSLDSLWEIESVDRKSEFENFVVIINAIPATDKQELEEIADLPSNSDILTQLQSDIHAEQDADFSQEGLDTSTYIMENEPATRDDYDPRPDESEEFLDDPNKKVF